MIMESKINVNDILTYQGNGDFFACLLNDTKDNYYIFISRTNGIDIIHEVEDTFLNKNIKFTTNDNLKLEIPLYKNKKGVFSTLIKLNDVKEYFTIVKVLEAIL